VTAFVVFVLAVAIALAVFSKPTPSRRVRGSAEPRTIAPTSAIEEIDPTAEGELEEEVRRAYTRKETYFRLQRASGQAFAVGYSEGSEWLDVITRKRRKGDKAGLFTGAYEHFGYDGAEGRWSYGEGPPGALELRRLLAHHLGAKERGRRS
jgi:hypothetical protein